MAQDHCEMVDFRVFLSVWNASQNQRTPALHHRMAAWLQKSWACGNRRLLLQAFRASGKSTVTGLYIAWRLCNNPDLRILVLSAESSLSEKMVRTVRKIIETHPLTSAIRPDRPDQWAADRFTVKRYFVSRDPSVLARGLYANITGARADIIICDDVEVPNTCETAEKRAKLRGRLCENDFILAPGGTILYIGTPHTYFTIYARHPRAEIGESEIFLKRYARLTLPLVNARGESAWPDRYDDAAIEELRLAAGPVRFASQMLLQPAGLEKGRLDPALLHRYGEEIEAREAQGKLTLTLCRRKLSSVSAWWDPAFGNERGDGSAIAIVYTDEGGDYWLHHIAYIKVRAGDGEDEAGLQCRAIAKLAQEFFLPSIAVETNGIGKFLPAILRRELAAARVPCAVVEKYSVKAKDRRILEAFDAPLAARAIHAHESVYKTRFITEMAEWKPGLQGAADDGLDAAAGALSLEPVRIQRLPFKGAKTWAASGQSHAAITDFEV